MAKVKNPLLSVTANGHLSKALTFYSHSKNNYVLSNKKRRGLFARIVSGFGRTYLGSSFLGFNGYRTGRNKKQLQSGQRHLFSHFWRTWSALSPSEKSEWSSLGRVYGLSGSQYYLKTQLDNNKLI